MLLLSCIQVFIFHSPRLRSNVAFRRDGICQPEFPGTCIRYSKHWFYNEKEKCLKENMQRGRVSFHKSALLYLHYLPRLPGKLVDKIPHQLTGRSNRFDINHSSLWSLLWTKCISSKSKSFNPQGDGIWRWNLWEVIRFK